MLNFQTSVIELIQKRCSWRTYIDKPVEADKLSRLNEFIASLDAPPFGSQTRFHVIDSPYPGNMGRVPGTYGFISGAKQFIAGAVKQSEKNMEDFGYLFEAIILFATDLGLGTCWIGGTFNRSDFAKTINLKNDEIFPATSPIGYAMPRRSMTDAIVRLGAQSKKRKPWQDMFFSNDFSKPLSKTDSGKYETVLEMVRLGPSASNKQPWRIIVDGKIFHLYLQRTRGYGLLWGIDLQRVDMGIAMCHFDLASQELGLTGSWKLTKPPNITLPPLTEYVASWVD
jgi:nitroreductase